MKLVGEGVGLIGAGSGTMELSDECVVITKKNVNLSGLGQGLAGALGTAAGAIGTKKGASYTVPYTALADAAVMKGGLLSKSFVQLVRPGERAVRNDQDAAGHPLCLIIGKRELANAQQFVSLLKARLTGR